jgi:hypothetical protein
VHHVHLASSNHNQVDALSAAPDEGASLSSDAAAYLSGVTIPVDGGFLTKGPV